MRRFPHLSLLATGFVALLLLCAPGSIGAASLPGNSNMDLKDFAFVKHQGIYHIFYTQVVHGLPDDEHSRALGHATSPDLIQWTELDQVLSVSDTYWDDLHVWAPSVVERDGVFYLFYTGVSRDANGYRGAQRIGLAISSDLVNWTRVDQPVLALDQMPWVYSNPGQYGIAFRDPFVMPDPTDPGRWLMYLGANPAVDSLSMVVGVAASSGDFQQWQDVGPLWITHRSRTYNWAAESPHVFDHEGIWYLCYTAESGQPINFCTSPTPLDPNSWVFRRRLSDMIGEDTQFWFASEHLRDGLVDYFAYSSGDSIEFKRIAWGSGYNFTLEAPDPFHVVRMAWSTSEVHVGDLVELQIESKNGIGRNAALEVIESDFMGHEVVVDPASVGLPSSVAITGETTVVPWTARLIDELFGFSGESTGLVVRMADHTAGTDQLVVRPAILAGPRPRPLPGPLPGPFPGPGDGLRPVGEGAGGAVAGAADDPGFLARVSGGASGRDVSFLVELSAAGEVKMDVFDLMGRKLRNLVSRDLPAGASLIPWDGRDDAGASVRPGIYFARVRSPQGAVRAVRFFVGR